MSLGPIVYTVTKLGVSEHEVTGMTWGPNFDSIVFSLLYEFFGGSFVSLPGVTIISLSPNLATIGIQLGMSFFIAGLGLLVGEPIAGAILRGQGGWIGLQVWCGVLLALSGIFSLAARIAKVGTRWGAKA